MNYRDVLFYKYLHGSGGSQPAWDGATFSSYAKGTEQILPENESDPDSAPFLGDIRYPDGTRRNNYFLYRESPNTVDGQAKITHIKGNTIVWNQLVQNGNFADVGTWLGTTYSVSNNIATITAVNNDQYIYQLYPSVNSHKYYFSFSCKAGTSNKIIARIYYGNYNASQKAFTSTSTSWEHFSSIITFAPTGNVCNIRLYSDPNGNQFKNVILIDLTQMGLDALTVDQFTSLYSLPYYDYTQGKLLPFKGESLKTTGKNLCDNSTIEIGWYDGVGNHNLDSAYRTSALIPVLPNTTYIATLFDSNKTEIGRLVYTEWDGNGNVLSQIASATITTSSKTAYIRIRNFANQMSYVTSDNFLYQLEIGSTATAYEPYTSSTINLPTLTYFPTGMKAVGSVYDEITESKAITRVGAVDLGTLTWSYNTSLSIFWSQPDSRFIANDNYECAKYEFIGVKNDSQMASAPDKTIGIGTGLNIKIKDSAYTDASSFAQAMSGTYLYYELATPTEEPISSQTQIQNQALSTILGKTVSVDSPEEPLNILLKGE